MENTELLNNYIENINTELDLKLSSYTYELDESFIANQAAEPRDSSKLMVINRKENNIEHKNFRDIIDYLDDNCILVLNDTRVIPARLFGKKNKDGANLEVFLVREVEKDKWITLVKPGKRLKVGSVVYFNDSLSGEVEEILESGERIIKFIYPENQSFLEIIKGIGQLPLPPYIKNPDCDPERYQTVYSNKEGSVAAPTAGLHFTEDLMNKLKNKGIKILYVTLNVGLGTFQPVKSENILEHNIHEEIYEVSEDTAEILNKHKQNGGKIVAVGTTTTRVLETNFSKHNKFINEKSSSQIFIYPGYTFKAIDSLITNFHLPESTLLMMISAFWAREKLLNAYETAKEKGYRFYSLGDSMYIF